MTISGLKFTIVICFLQGTQIELSIGVILGISTMAGKQTSWFYIFLILAKEIPIGMSKANVRDEAAMSAWF